MGELINQSVIQHGIENMRFEVQDKIVCVHVRVHTNAYWNTDMSSRLESLQTNDNVR